MIRTGVCKPVLRAHPRPTIQPEAIMATTTRRAAVLLLILLGCGRENAREDVAEYGVAAGKAAPAPARTAVGVLARDAASSGDNAMDAAAPEQVAPTETQDPAAAPMVIRTGNASIQIDSLETAIGQVRALADRVGGYIANSQIQSGDNQVRSANIEIKVPANRFDALVTGLTPLGKVEYVNVSAQDVGEEFTDVTARVANSRRLESRLIELLATRTGKLSDVLEIERELARVREEIERMEGRLRYLRAHVATSSLTVTVHEKAPLVGEQGSGGVIGEAFRQAWRNFVRFVAGLIASLGVVVPMGGLLLVGLWLLRKLWRARHS